MKVKILFFLNLVFMAVWRISATSLSFSNDISLFLDWESTSVSVSSWLVTTSYNIKYTRKATPPRGIENGPCSRLLNLSSAWCGVTFDFMTRNADHFVHLSRGPLMPTGMKIGSLIFEIISFTSLLTDERTNRHRGREHYPACLSRLAEAQ